MTLRRRRNFIPMAFAKHIAINCSSRCKCRWPTVYLHLSQAVPPQLPPLSLPFPFDAARPLDMLEQFPDSIHFCSQPLGSGVQYCSDRYRTFVDNAAAIYTFQASNRTIFCRLARSFGNLEHTTFP